MGTPHFAAPSFNLFKRSPPELPAVLFQLAAALQNRSSHSRFETE
jgi:hypothetical protein